MIFSLFAGRRFIFFFTEIMFYMLQLTIKWPLAQMRICLLAERNLRRDNLQM